MKKLVATRNDTETSDGMARHRAMAAARGNTARCLESGNKEEVCDQDPRPACKGPTIGKYCDMKHGHWVGACLAGVQGPRNSRLGPVSD